jgi:F0F1-type ATP synthase membrane subunit c/vacuolar-type H+-ATPase subunit K
MLKRWSWKNRRGKDKSMPENIIVEVLAAHADQLANSETDAEDYANLFPAHEAELASLLQVAQQIKRVLVPVTPSPEFETGLKRDLLAAALQRANAKPTKQQTSLLYRRRFLIGAAIGSAISLVGIIAALLLRQRSTAGV